MKTKRELPSGEASGEASGWAPPADPWRTAALHLLRTSAGELRRLEAVRGASRRTAARAARAAAALSLAGGLLGGAAPCVADFRSPLPPFSPSYFAADVRPALGDLDGDGDLDALVGDAFGRLAFFENVGSGSAAAFTRRPSVDPAAITAGAAHPTLGDLDGDGDLDAIVGSRDGTLSFLENTGAAGVAAFAAPVPGAFGLATGASSARPALGDLDGDGDLDVLVAAGSAPEEVLVLANTGSPSQPAFAPPAAAPLDATALPGSGWTPALVDWDGDSDLDLVLAAATGALASDVLLLENTGSPQTPAFAPPLPDALGLGPLPESAAAAFGDLDGDGDADALVGMELVSGGTAAFALTFEHLGPGAFASSSIAPFGLRSRGQMARAALGDLDGDGDLDALVGSADGRLSFFANTGSPQSPAFAPPLVDPFGLADVGFWAAPALADLDGDGDLDALVGNGDGRLSFFANTGSPQSPAFAPPVVDPFGLTDVGSGASPPALADLDGDGDLDALVGSDDGHLSFSANTGSAQSPAFAPPLVDPFGLADVGFWAVPALADLDSDGDLDALVGRATGGPVLFENTGTARSPSFAPAVAEPLGLAPAANADAPALGDLDGDGDLDVLLGHRDGHLLFFENAGGPPPGGGGGFSCPHSPDATCVAGFSNGSLLVRETRPGREKLVARLRRGPSIPATDLGDPLGPGGSDYALCVYDEVGALVAELRVERAGDQCDGVPCWRPLTDGLLYRDRKASASGVRELSLRRSASGSPRLRLVAGNNARKGQTSLPTGIAAALETSARAEIQVLVSSPQRCFAATLDDVRRRSSVLFRAR